ncbi:hypothetical protein [Streptomyces tritici]|uniref:hypothetical protein n=1 Tax=Streptomyces tritici TaxID=2054410 RepID=UPI003AF122C9
MSQQQLSDELKLAYEQNAADFAVLDQRLQELQQIAKDRLADAGLVLLPGLDFPCLVCPCPGYSRDPSIPSTGCICNDPAHTHWPV